jgi:hypothetical protein
MTAERPPAATSVEPVASLDDPRAVQILSTEHWSLLTARSLAYNEAFTRAGMFLTFLSMSFVALALFSSAMGFSTEFLAVAAVLLGFDLLIGIATYGRIMGANLDDMRAVHGMARIRHAYTEIAPLVRPYFTSAIHDDPAGIGLAYGNQPTAFPGVLYYGLTTSGGMIGLILALVGGAEAAVVVLLLGAGAGAALGVGIGGAIVVFGLITGFTVGRVPSEQTRLPVMFPTPAPSEPAEPSSTR